MEHLSWLDAGGVEGLPEAQWEDGERRLVRTWRSASDGRRQSCIAVVPSADRPSPNCIDRLHHEYAMREYLDGDWALRPLDLLERGRPILVLEDRGGEVLEGLVGAPMETGRFLQLAIPMAAALGRAHERGIVHKDIKPANVFIHPQGAVWLTGFGIASRLPRERQAPDAPEIIAGTLAYMSPEQTGRMNRSIDSRSDLYSLGITFYRMLTGALPYSASDPMGWVHSHIARLPAPPHERAPVPATISAIVMKLLAKTAEDRYQTAAGAESDLRRCQAEWQGSGEIKAFPPGLKDSPNRLLMPEKLYGRESQVETLLSAFERIVHGGPPELVLVSGYSGVGKSSVINEVHKALLPPRGLFASGKFEQYQRDVPYSTLAQAFQTLVRHLLAKSDAELAPWREALLEALGPNGRLITDLVPELAIIIGEQPPVPELPPQQAQSRFQLVFRRFIGAFAQEEHPLALALDDLQWLDAATLDLVEDMLTRADMQHLLLIGAYRDNEVSADHPLIRKIEAIRAAGAPVHQIRLEPLTGEDLRQLIEDGLRCEAARAAPLARLLHEKTAGNPFFAIQFLAELAEEGLLNRANDQGHWTWDPAHIHAKGYTANVVDLMVGRLSRLSAATKTALQHMACLGHFASTAALALAQGSSQEQVEADLWSAVRLELVERVDGGFKFAHDRVHEAAYGLIPVPWRAAAHLRIGRLLLAEVPAGAIENAVFDIVNHFNQGADLIEDPQEREHVADMNVTAGKRARRSTAYASARNYLRQAVSLLAPDPWKRRYQATFDLHLLLSECEYLVGNFAVADGLFDTMLDEAASELDRAKVHTLRIKLCQVAGKIDEGLAVGLRALRSFGVTFPESDPEIEQAVATQFARLPQGLAGRAIGDLLAAPVATNPTTVAIIDLLVEIAPCAYSAWPPTRPPLWPLVTLEAVNRSIRDGNTEQSSYAYAVLALWLVAGPQDVSSAYQFSELSLRLNERFGNRRLRGTLLHLHADHVNFWRRHFSTGLPILEQAFGACLEVGDFVYAGFLAFQTLLHRWENGDALEDVLSASVRFATFAQQIHNNAILQTIRLEQCFVIGLLGRTPDALVSETFDAEASVEATVQAAFLTGTALHHVMTLILASLCGRHAEAVEAASKAEPLLAALMTMPMEASFHFFHALSLAALHPTVERSQQEGSLRVLHEKHGKLVFWAKHCPENFEGRAMLIGAEIARLENRVLDAERLYETAIRSAAAHGFIHHQAFAYEAAARFYEARDFDEIATLYLRNARHCYLRWGAGTKVRLLDEAHPELRETGQVPAGTSTIGTPVEHLDLATVIKVSQAVSGEIVLERLLDTLMRTAIEHAGAERGLLILAQGGAPRIAAEATTAGDSVLVQVREQPIADASLPQSVFHYVLRTQESVILDEACERGAFSSDPYVMGQRARSVLCMPLLNQAKLIGMLYLENNLAPGVFTPARIPVLKLLASEAAISLENTRLYRDLAERESRIRRLVDANIIGIFIWDLTGRIVDANDALLRLVGYGRQDLAAGSLRWTNLTPPEWREQDERGLAPEVKVAGSLQPFEKEYFRKDGSRVPVLVGAAAFEGAANEGVAFVLDLSERKRSEAEARDRERRYHEMEMRLMEANRIVSIGQLSATIAHELNQPLASIMTNASTCVRKLGADPPNLPGATETAGRLIRDANRASEVINRLRDLFTKREIAFDWVNVNDAAREVVALSASALQNDRMDLQCDFEEGLPLVKGDRIQLQQVIMNLLRNAVDAMRGIDGRPRQLAIRTQRSEENGLRLTVRDTGVGFDVKGPEQLFEAFYTTKSGGMGIGLSVSRSIIERHRGRLWAEANEGPGATFSFTIPIAPRDEKVI